jgi:hypothetical protein
MTVFQFVSSTDFDELRADILDVVNRLLDQVQELHEKNAEQDAEIRALRLATDPTLYTAKQVEQVLGITAPTRRELTARGDLPVVHLDSRPRYRKVDVEALIAEKAA